MEEKTNRIWLNRQLVCHTHIRMPYGLVPVATCYGCGAILEGAEDGSWHHPGANPGKRTWEQKIVGEIRAYERRGYTLRKDSWPMRMVQRRLE